MPDVTVDLTVFNELLTKLAAEVPKSAAVIVEDQARLLVEDLGKALPPKSAPKLVKTIKARILSAYEPAKGRRGTRQIDMARYKALRSGKKLRGRRVKVNEAVLMAFIASRQKNVGLLKASFMGSGNPLNAKMSKEAASQPQHGTTEIRRDETQLTVEITSQLDYAAKSNRVAEVVERVLLKRSYAMMTLLKRLARGLATKYSS